VPSIVPLLNHDQTAVRVSAARALGLLNVPSVWSYLVEALNVLDINVKAMAVWALSEINSEKAVSGLTALMKKHQDLRLMESSVKALAKLDHKTAREVLMTSLAENEDYRFESINPDNPQDLRKSEKLLKILGKDYAIARLAAPGGDETKTILQYLDLVLLQYKSGDLSKSAKNRRSFP
jgi:HEAT repeat protein